MAGISNRDKLRLGGGKSRCSGRVEIWHNGSWGTVCSFNWDLEDANVVCQQLGCGSAQAALKWGAFGPGNGSIWLDEVQCTGTESFLWNCPAKPWGQNNCIHEYDAGVMCSGFIKLVAGDGPCNGRVEVNAETKWSTVCDWNFTLPTAKVICAELQCGTAVSIMKGAHFGRGNGPIWDKEFQCNGSEPLLPLCPTVPLPQGKCSHSMDVGVICSRYTDFRLMNGSSQCEGRVEIQVLGTWRTLCESHWDLADANVLCHQLSCGVTTKPPEDVHFGKGSVQIIGDTFYCTGTESHLWDCPVTILGTSQCSKGKVASVVCSGNQSQSLTFNNSQYDQELAPVLFSENGQLRLLNGSGPCSGRVEVYYNGTWGTICDDSWDLSEAHVVCRQLGCGVALKIMVSAHFGQGSGPIWLDELNCSGNESHLGECPSVHWGHHDCRHKENVGVLCSESLDFRLVSEDYKCSGWLEVFYNGTWGSVCSNSMEDSTVSVICRHLSCGSKGRIETFSSPREGLGARWIDRIMCQGQESFLWHCPSQPWDQNSCQQGEEALITCEDKDKLQLKGGDTRCSGRVEIWHNGSWGTVCVDPQDQMAVANVFCQQLGCGSAVDVVRGAVFGPGEGIIWLVQCKGTESSLWDCHRRIEQNFCTHEYDVGVRCSGFVKLVAGDGPCNGRVEVNSERKMSTVCDWNFTLSTAKVICAELQCGTAVSIMKGAHFGRGNGPIWDKEFQCNGRYTDFRLMNGSSQCEGRVEIQVLGTWRNLCDSHWDLADANVLCHQLNCGIAMKPPEDVHFDKGIVQIIGDTFYCTGTESHLWDCPVTILGTSTCSKVKVAFVVCSGNQTQSLIFNNSRYDQELAPVLFSVPIEHGQLRLLNGRGPCTGRVEVYYNGTWGTICDDSWDLSDAHVVCRQLGCGVALEVMVSAHFGQGSGPIWLDELSCSGNESHLGECPSVHWGQHDCRHKEDAGVLCSESLDLRLVSEEHKCSGWLEVFYNGTWGSVCSNSMDDNTVSVICRHLSCGSKGHIETFSSSQKSLGARWIDRIKCQGQESLLWHCPSQPWDQNSCQQGEETLLTCEDKLRLRGGDSLCSGRVEIWHNGSWGTVCDDSWDLADAHVVCQQLDCGSALAAPQWSAFGPGNGTIWLDDVQCRGRESSLWDCPAMSWGQNDCKHEEDAGVICSVESTTLLSTTKGPTTRTVSASLNSLLGISCLILGALLFLVLILLGIQMHRGRIQQQALSRYRDSLYEAVYQDIDYYVTGDKEDLLSSPDVSSQPDDPPGDGYDDAEELSGPAIPPVTLMNEEGTLGPTDARDEYRESHTGQSPKSFRGSPDSKTREDDPPMFSEDQAYDEAETGVPQKSI
ncbi:antigen WC1.1-like [Trichosurus vulpecula]|uniref:antigen WC1.1-like n=1 Tax=Trichosurus vulpecula TaxID=9337 RepID=UPI00186ABD2E|nr:antigen WC1.1-like [Trichosurus vulpecula]